MLKLIVFTFFTICFFTSNVFAEPSKCSGKNILLCHKAGKNSKESKEICINISAIDSHLINHSSDFIGTCSSFDPALITSYACNAGLKFNINSERTCIRHDENGIIASNCGTSVNCTCSESKPSDDSYQLNNMKFSSANYREDFSLLNFLEHFKVASTTPNYNQVTNELGSQVLKGDSALQFNFGSERYGAQYFVDMCIRNENIYPSQVPLNINGNIIYSAGVFSNENYPQSSKLIHSMRIFCDEKTEGSLTLAENSFFSQTGIPFTFGQRDFETQVPGSRFCIVRHFFKENQNQSLRNNLAKKAIFQTNLDVLGDMRSIVEPINLCRIQDIGKKKFACTSITFKNSEAMKEFILTNYGKGNSSDFQKDFKDMHNSSCPVPCSAL